MTKFRGLLAWLVIPVLLFPVPASSQAQRDTSLYQTETTRWRASDNGFAGWALAGIKRSPDGSLSLDSGRAREETDPYRRGAYEGGNFYNGGTFLVGEATSPVVKPAVPFSEAIASWNAATPPGTWIEAQLRAQVSGQWTRWYSMGVWASGTDEIARHSVKRQEDDAARVDVDTLKIGGPGTSRTGSAYQLKIRLFASSADSSPAIVQAAVVVSSKQVTPTLPSAGDPAQWAKRLLVPECSQMVYPGGGEVWCSPTSVAMVIAYWENRFGSCAADVHAAVEGVYDRVYDGHGNWPFNTAYAYSLGHGLQAYVSRYNSLAALEKWIGAGVPVLMSVGWGRNQLDGAPIPASNGHLIVLVGFDAQGNPIVNDPAAASNVAVQRTYTRGELERAWLQNSGGTVYLIYPANRQVPTN